MTGQGGGSDGVDEAYAHRAMDGFGAFILGRNMFGPVRGPWPDESWKGWCGVNPPYHVPVFVLTHHPRASLEMEGGTTFHFVTDGIHAALERAEQAARGKDGRLGGGDAAGGRVADGGAIDQRIDRARVAPLRRIAAPAGSANTHAGFAADVLAARAEPRLPRQPALAGDARGDGIELLEADDIERVEG